MTIDEAIAKITAGNKQRCTGYVCTTHKKEHKFSFINKVTFTHDGFVGFDTEDEVIEYAKDYKDKL
jgi:hypothetical protein